VHVVPADSPEQPKVTVPLNPPTVVKVITSVLVDPRETVSVEVAGVIVKSVFVKANAAVDVPMLVVAVTL